MNGLSVRFSLVFVVAALVLVACGGGAAPTAAGPTGDPAHGQQQFSGTCASCHGPDAKGIAGLGKDLTTSDFAKSKTDVDLVAFLKTGRPSSDSLNTTGVDMPPKGGNPALTDEDLLDIVAYLRTLQK